MLKRCCMRISSPENIHITIANKHIDLILFDSNTPLLCSGDKGHAYPTWDWISYMSPSSCGGALDAPPALLRGMPPQVH
jgi:hypothetical protein